MAEEEDLHGRGESFFKLLEEIFKDMSLLEKAIRESGIDPYELGFSKPFYYGFELKLGPDGRLIFKEFGNIRRAGVTPKIREEIEPLSDIIEKEDEIWIMVELPGVEREDIKVNYDEKVIRINATSEMRKYSKEIVLPLEVDPRSGTARYKNGILELKLKKVPSETQGERIRVE